MADKRIYQFDPISLANLRDTHRIPVDSALFAETKYTTLANLKSYLNKSVSDFSIDFLQKFFRGI